MISARRKRPVVLANAAGWGNFGDDLLAVAATELFRADPRVGRISVLSGPRAPFSAPANTAFVDWQHRVRAGRRLAEASAMLIAGGGVLNDRPLQFYRPYVRAAQLCAATGGRIVISSVGVFSENPSAAFAKGLRSLASRAVHFTVRDSTSADLVASVTGQTPGIVPDLAFGLTLPAAPRVDRRHIGVCVRPWWPTLASADSAARMERMLRTLAGYLLKARDAAAPDAKILLIPFHIATADDDRPQLKRLQALLGSAAEVSDPKAPGDVIRAVGRCRVLLGMRLHSLIVAASLGIPPVAIAYDPKIDGMMEALRRRDFVIPVDRVDDVDVSELLSKALSSNLGALAGRVASLRSQVGKETAAVLSAALDR